MKLSRKALPILLTLHRLQSHFNKLYCYPSQDKLLDLLEKFCSLKMSRRQLNYDLKVMEKHGLIRRVRRHRRTKKRGMEFRSTLYEICFLGYNLLCRCGAVAWSVLRDFRARVAAKLKEKQKPCAISDPAHGFSSISDILSDALPV